MGMQSGEESTRELHHLQRKGKLRGEDQTKLKGKKIANRGEGTGRLKKIGSVLDGVEQGGGNSKKRRSIIVHQVGPRSVRGGWDLEEKTTEAKKLWQQEGKEKGSVHGQERKVVEGEMSTN